MLRHFTKQVLLSRSRIREEAVWNLMKETKREYQSVKKVPEFTKVSSFFIF